MTIKNKILCLASYIQYPVFPEQICNERALITIKEKKKEICDSSIQFPPGYYGKNINIFNEKLTNGLFLL